MPTPPHASTAPLGLRNKHTHTQLHAHMYQKHLDTKTESTYMKPEGNRHSQDPSLIDKALNSQGFLEIYTYFFFQAGSWEKEAETAL